MLLFDEEGKNKATERSCALNSFFNFDGEIKESKAYRHHMRYLIRPIFRKRNGEDRWPRYRDAANPFTIVIYQGPRLVALNHLDSFR